MPSPFPGMDPYIERPVIWPNMHQRLITGISTALNAILPPKYVADIGERLYLEHFQKTTFPDVAVMQVPKAAPNPPLPASGGTAVCDEPLKLVAFDEETRQPFIQIVHTGNEPRIVVEIEILSPSNKDAGSRGRREYLEKQERILFSGVHFIEIDLLRAGAYTIASPRPSKDKHAAWDYLVSLHRADSLNEFEVWARTVRQPLPRIAIPLLKGDDDVVLDLQDVFSRCYDEGRFNVKLNYGEPAEPPLNPNDDTWANELLKQRNLR